MMKSYLTLFSAILIAGAALAQTPRDKAIAKPIEDHVLTNDRPDNLKPIKMEADLPEQEGPTLFSDDFSSGMGNWDNEALTGYTTTALWEYRGPNTTPDTGTGSRGAYAGGGLTILSATRDNGFLIFDSDYLDNGGTVGGSGPGITPHAGALTSPYIDCSGEQNVLLSFHSYFRQYDAHGFVFVSTDNFATQDTVYNASWFHDYNDAGPRDEVVKVNISQTAGGSASAQVRFVFHEAATWSLSGYYYWQIDDVKVQGGSDWDLSIEDVFYNGGGSDALNFQYSSFYRTIPEKQAAAMDLNFGVALRSLSQSTQTNAHLQTDVSGSSTFSGTSPNVDYSVFNTPDTVDLTTSFTPLAKGMHTVQFEVSGDSADDFIGDNTITETFEVTDQIMGWDDGFVGGAVSWADGYGILKRFDVFEADTLAGIEFGIFSTSNFATDHGSLVLAGIWKVTGGKIGNAGGVDLSIPEESEFVSLDSNMFTTYDDSNKVIRLNFEELFPIDTGEYLIGWIGQSGVIRTPMSNRPAGLVNSFITTDGSSIAGWIDYNPIIRMVFYNGDYCADNPVALTGTINCNPSEWTADVIVEAENGDSNATFTYSWSDGSVFDSITVGDEGTYTVDVTDNNQCKGSMEFLVYNNDINCNLGKGELDLESFHIYPNPNSGLFQVQLGNISRDDLTITVRDIRGAIATTKALNGVKSNFVIDLRALNSGIYSAQLVSDGKVLGHQKLVVID